MSRKMNWDKLLANYLESHRNTPFAWGTHDCCMFAANAVLSICDIDYAADFRGHYSTEIGSKRALIRYGQRDIKSTLNRILGESVSPLNARRGDVCLVDLIPHGHTVAVFYNGLWAAGETGLVNIPKSKIICAWRVA